MKLPQHLHKIMGNKNSQIAALVTHAKYLSRLTEAIQCLLPLPLSEHVHVINFQHNILTIATDKPVWAARMRYSTPELRHKLKSHALFPGKINEIAVKVSPVSHSSEPSRAQLRSVDSASLSALADQVNDDNLKQALLRLASHTQKIK